MDTKIKYIMPSKLLKKIKYLGVNLTRHIKDLCAKC